jgi:hypothetical protein
MSKFYTIRSADGQRSYGSVTKTTAKGMVRRGEATFVDNCSVIRLAPPKEESTSEVRNPEKKYGVRGLSASPTAELSHRYVEARFSDRDQLALDAIDGWRPICTPNGTTHANR